MHAVSSEQAAFFAVSEGGPMAILFSAAHPERTRRGWCLWQPTLGLPCGPITRSGCRLNNSTNRCDTSSLDGEPVSGWAAGLRAWRNTPCHGSSLHACNASARARGAAMALMSSYMDIDVRPALPLVHAPTLVLHRSGDRMVPVSLGRYLAEHIDGARLVELPGTDHFWWTQTPNRSSGRPRSSSPAPVPYSKRTVVLASVLFTDIVDSTRRAVELGDREWRSLLNRHDSLSEREVTRYGGRLIKTTGDGVLATFDGPARSVRCAQSLNDGAKALGIVLRAGVHTGRSSCAAMTSPDSGSISPRGIEALAQPGEILVSRTVTDLVAGSGLDFDDRGKHDFSRACRAAGSSTPRGRSNRTTFGDIDQA